MTPDDLRSPIEIFFNNWSYTAGAIMSSVLFVVAVGRIVSMIAKAYIVSVEEAVKQALINQRQDNQAEVLDEFIKVIKEQQVDIKEYSKQLCRSADEKAAVNLFLKRRNVTLKD